MNTLEKRALPQTKAGPESEVERSTNVLKTYPGWLQPRKINPPQGRGQEGSNNSGHKG